MMHGVFAADVAVTGIAAWLLVCASGHAGRGCLEGALAWLWSVTALVAAAGIILGITGGLGPAGFLGAHSVVLATIALFRRRTLHADLAALRSACAQARQFFNTPGTNRLLASVLVLILAALAVIDMWAQPEVLDALTYHLPRVGHWLQDGRIRMMDTPDARANFIAALPEVVMAWFVGPMREGFRTAVLPQAMGGIMAVGATVGLARQSGLGRSASLMAAGLLLGMAVFSVQFTAAQTDLLTTGIFATSFYLWLAALKRGGSSALGALGAGMALAAKGTLFYLAPGALLWVAWLSWHHPVSWSKWRSTLLMGILGIVLFALPGFARNRQAYGSVLGPEAWVKKHHNGFDSVSGLEHKLYWNVTSALAQNFDPQSQPLGLRSLSRATGTALVARLPPEDPYTLRGVNRKGALTQILQRDEPDADVTSFGIVALLLFPVGTFLALVAVRDRPSRLILVWSAGTIAFFIFFYGMQQWHPFGFRYLLLGTPWIAIVSAWGLEQLGRPLRQVVWALALLASLDVGWHVTTRTSQAGWQSVTDPARYLGDFVASGWRDWSEHLDHPEGTFLIALPEERPISAFYRQIPRRQVGFKADPGRSDLTAEEFVRGENGWVIVPATRFLGHEGNVAASVWLFGGDPSNVYSVAAYRALDSGETPPAIVYRQRRAVTETTVTFDLLVKSAAGQPIQMALSNPGEEAVTYEWSTPIKRGKGVLRAKETVSLTLPLPRGPVGEVNVAFALPAKAGPFAALPSAEVLPSTR
jgi:hypothetical protein